jgi:hypothetical protein
MREKDNNKRQQLFPNFCKSARGSFAEGEEGSKGGRESVQHPGKHRKHYENYS